MFINRQNHNIGTLLSERLQSIEDRRMFGCSTNDLVSAFIQLVLKRPTDGQTVCFGSATRKNHIRRAHAKFSRNQLPCLGDDIGGLGSSYMVS